MRKATLLPLSNAMLPWLLAAQSLILFQHRSYLTLSLWGLVLLFMLWRWLINLGKLNYPNKAIKVAVSLATLLVLSVNIQGFNLESAASFLLVTSLLKLIELKTLRDGYIAIFLNFFVLATGFLFVQDILAALLAIIVVLLLLVALSRMHYSADANIAAPQLLKSAASILLLSLPMMLVLYLLFPRLGPLWSFSLQSGQAKTGLSDVMSAADIAEISQSPELAFRVSFSDNQQPARQQLYWRALVLDYYDGRQWSVTHQGKIQWHQSQAVNNQYSYEIIQEPHHKNWLFALSQPIAMEPRTGVTDDQRLVARTPVYQRLRYQVAQDNLTADVEPLTDFERKRYLQLPANRNPQTLAWAQQLSGDKQQIATQIMQQFINEDFYYTLKPQTYGEHEIDEFMFVRQQGFCAHYSSAMAFMARAAGIPARVVTGYQGGEWNQQDNFLTVRQYDAHAWVELWFDDIGWQQYDPTAMVAEDRILYGLEQAIALEGTFLQGQINLHRFQSIQWVNRMRAWSAMVEYGWQKWVLSYDNERQSSFLQNVLKLKDYQQGLYLLAASFIVFFLIATTWLWWRLRPAAVAPLLQAWQHLQMQAKKQGLQSEAGETLGQFLQRCAQQWPSLAEDCAQLNQRVNDSLYRPTDSSAELQLQLINELKALAKKVAKLKVR